MALRPSQRRSTAQFACTVDERFSFCLYVPDGYDERSQQQWPLVVAVHGTLRESQLMRDRFARFATAHSAIVLSPLFPAGIGDPLDVNNYKLIEYRGIRFDRILLSMIEQIAALYRLEFQRVLMYGFSGGGQFVHRFLYLHPHRLRAVSIGAPGLVTLLDPAKRWWVGTGGLHAALGVEPDLEAMRQVKVQMIIGAEDSETEVTVEPSSRLYMPGVNDAGTTRIERLRSLAASFAKHGIPVRFDLVPDVGHEYGQEILLTHVYDFFGDVLAGPKTTA
jgi:poly(3-hydroxybutyrate) depolymerase